MMRAAVYFSALFILAGCLCSRPTCPPSPGMPYGGGFGGGYGHGPQGPQPGQPGNPRRSIDPRRVFDNRPTPPGAHDGFGSDDRPVHGTTTESEALIRAVRAFGAPSANDDPLDDSVCAGAESHARAMAAAQAVSHNGSDRRIHRLGGAGGGEIVAVNNNATAEEGARQCVQQWEESAGHRIHMQRENNGYCYSMVQGTYQGMKAFYCIGVFRYDNGAPSAVQQLVNHNNRLRRSGGRGDSHI
ncbi:MAG: hypothetical protein HYR96_07005 [Deltaproteobacteria bacterium]|nr:hypothetical protein [Deltaproteobacteria bacterium]MBI3295350.1 hypothetical protein [Deltaproteobacteria bacterium]